MNSKDVFLSLTPQEYKELSERAEMEGLKPQSYLKRLLRPRHGGEQSNKTVVSPQIYWESNLGKMWHGNSLGLMRNELKPNSVDLIVTSPPFGLVRKKAYGNESSADYCDWFRNFAKEFWRVLKPEGSLVIDVGGSWIKGIPARSLYHFELLIMLCREYGFYLCLEHYWWNPAKMPTPAEWVNIRRIRVKDAVNTVWWLSKTPYPRASNRRVLSPYKPAQEKLMKKGYQKNVTRPSEHHISDQWDVNNGGSVPPNLLAISNTDSNSRYHRHCKEHNLTRHPARFPSELPEYFIRMLTDPGDVVLDPFGGSCVTGEVAEKLKRRWHCCELNEEYLMGAIGRFESSEEMQMELIGSDSIKRGRAKFRWATATQTDAVQIAPPCALHLDDEEALAPDGGKSRP